MGYLILSYLVFLLLQPILRFITFNNFSSDFYEISSLFLVVFGWVAIGIIYLLNTTKSGDRILGSLERSSERRKTKKKVNKRMSKIDTITKELEQIKKEYELEPDSSIIEPFKLNSKTLYLTNDDKYNFVIEQESKADALFERYKDCFTINERGVFPKGSFDLPIFSDYRYQKEDIEYLQTIYPIDLNDIGKIINKRKQCFNAILDIRQKITSDSIITQKGKHGEDSVIKFLNYYKDNYIILENILVDFDGETSESDAIIVCDKGVFVIEIKNHGNVNSTLSISSDGRWAMIKNGKKEFKDNVFEQNNRHCAINQTILNRELKNRGINMDYIKCNSIIVIANDKVEIDNESSNAILRKSEIITYIENLQTSTKLSKDIQEEIADIFKSKNLPPKKFPVTDLYNDYCIALREFEKLQKILTGYYLLEKTYRKHLE